MVVHKNDHKRRLKRYKPSMPILTNHCSFCSFNPSRNSSREKGFQQVVLHQTNTYFRALASLVWNRHETSLCNTLLSERLRVSIPNVRNKQSQGNIANSNRRYLYIYSYCLVQFSSSCYVTPQLPNTNILSSLHLNTPLIRCPKWCQSYPCGSTLPVDPKMEILQPSDTFRWRRQLDMIDTPEIEGAENSCKLASGMQFVVVSCLIES